MKSLPVLAIAGLLLLNACSTGRGSQSQEMSASAVERQVTVHGSAPIRQAGKQQARKAAIDQAMEQAAIELGNRNHAMSMSDAKVVDEWQENDQYHVQILVQLSNKAYCASNHRKKIVATAFPVMHGDEIAGSESQDLFSGIPREISNQLMESGHFIARNQTRTVLYAQPELAPEIPLEGIGLTNSPILRLARLNDAQFVLSGVIRDFRVESTEYTRGAGILAQMKWAMRDVIARRSIGIDIYLHDGYTGALLFQQRYSDSILGDVYLPSGYTVGSERFESHPAGHAISNIIRQASDDIATFLSCQPLAARITQVNSDQVTIAAGAQDNVRVGERMLIYSAGFTHTVGLGFNEVLATLRITTVGPTMATGKVEANQGIVRPGDWVRIEDATR